MQPDSGTPSAFIKYRSSAPQPFGWGHRPIRGAAAILQRFTRICRGRRPRSLFPALVRLIAPPRSRPAIRGERYEQVENRRGRRGCRRGRGRGCGPCPARPWPDPGRARARVARARSPDRWEPDRRVDPRRRRRRREEPERRECRRPRGGGLDRQPRGKGRHPQGGRDRRVRRRAGPERPPVDAAGPGNRPGANRRRNSSARRAADDGLGDPARRQQLQLPRARRSRRLGPGVPLPFVAARDRADAADAAEPAQPSHAADPTVAPHGLGLRRPARPRRAPRHLDRFALSAAGRILRHQGRRARHVRLRRFSGGKGRAEGGRRDHQLQRRVR